MIKTALRFLITIFIVILSIYSYIQGKDRYIKDNHVFISFNSSSEMEQGIEYLKSSGLTDLLYLEGITVPVNNFFEIKEMTLDQIKKKIDVNDYRYDPFIKSIPVMFSDGFGGYNSVYVNMGSKSSFRLIKFFYSARKNSLDYNIGTPGIIRQFLNYICALVIFLMFGLGSKARSVISLLTTVSVYFFVDISSYYNYISVILVYFLIIFVIESAAFSNRYVRRDNIGFPRTLLCIFLFTLPTFYPFFTDMKHEAKIIKSDNEYTLDYASLEELYDPGSPSLSNYFAHYAYQKSYLYGEKYKFPKENSNVKMVEFEREEHFLKEHDEIIMTFDKEFHNKFLEYCSSSELGRFYLNVGRSFNFERGIMSSSYKKEKEYMQIGILAVTMLLSSAFFKKKRR